MFLSDILKICETTDGKYCFNGNKKGRKEDRKMQGKKERKRKEKINGKTDIQ